MTLPQAAEYCGMQPKTLRNKLSAGNGPRSYRLAGRKFRQADLDAWINEHADRPGSRSRRPRTVST